MIELAVWILKATKAIFGSENFMAALRRIVEGRQGRKDVEHSEDAEVRELERDLEMLKLSRKLERKERRRDKKNKRKSNGHAKAKAGGDNGGGEGREGAD